MDMRKRNEARARLIRERDRLLADRKAHLADDKPLYEPPPSADHVDVATRASEANREHALGDRELGELREIERALRRLEETDCQLCSNCGQPIEEGRFELVPTTSSCARCASELASYIQWTS